MLVQYLRVQKVGCDIIRLGSRSIQALYQYRGVYSIGVESCDFVSIPLIKYANSCKKWTWNKRLNWFNRALVHLWGFFVLLLRYFDSLTETVVIKNSGGATCYISFDYITLYSILNLTTISLNLRNMKRLQNKNEMFSEFIIGTILVPWTASWINWFEKIAVALLATLYSITELCTLYLTFIINF